MRPIAVLRRLNELLRVLIAVLLVLALAPTARAKASDDVEQVGKAVTSKKIVQVDMGIGYGDYTSYPTHSGAISEDGELWMWGKNSQSEIMESSSDYYSSPVKVMEDVAQVAVGQWCTAAIREDGTLWTWGANSTQLGQGNGANTSSPKQIMEQVAYVDFGASHAAAIMEDGTLWTWGSNEKGELGREGDSSEPAPMMSNVDKVALGSSFTAALKDDGTLWIWGSNQYGQLGENTDLKKRTEPEKVLDHVVDVACGWYHIAALKDDGTLWMWGRNNHGQLGDGTSENGSVPKLIMENVSSMSLGDFHSGAVKEDGTLWTWGKNGWGELGNGTTNPSRVPIAVSAGVSSISFGGSVSGLVKTDGSLWTWGCLMTGALGDGTTWTAGRQCVKSPGYIMGPSSSGSETGSFFDIANASVYLDGKKGQRALSLQMTGVELKPSITVFSGDGESLFGPLKEDKDYTVVYYDNVNRGVASVTVTGKGDYSGSQNVEFLIVDEDGFYKEKAPSGFQLGRDNNSYTNASDDAGDGFEGLTDYATMTKDDWWSLVKNASPSDAAWLYLKSLVEFGGSCFGVSSTMALAFDGTIPLSSLSSDGTSEPLGYYDLVRPVDNQRLLSAVTYYQLAQFLPERKSDVVKQTVSWSGVTSDSGNVVGNLPWRYDSIEETLKELVGNAAHGNGFEDAKVHILSYGVERSGVGPVRHTVLAVGARHISGPDGYAYEVLLVDPNFPESSEFTKMLVSDDFKNFSFSYGPGGIVDQSNFWYLTVDSPEAIANVGGGISAVSARETSEMVTLRISLTAPFVLKNADGETLVFDGSAGLGGDLSASDWFLATSDDATTLVVETGLSDAFYLDGVDGQIEVSASTEDSLVRYSGAGSSSIELRLDTPKVAIDGEKHSFAASASSSTSGLVSFDVTAVGHVEVSANATGAEIVADSPLESAKAIFCDAKNYVSTEQKLNEGVTAVRADSPSESLIYGEDLPEEPSTPSIPVAPSVPMYDSAVVLSGDGMVTVSPSKAAEGEKITVTATPDLGWELAQLTVADEDGNALELTENADGTYSFEMPAGDVAVHASFACDGGELCPSHGFADVDQEQWYHAAIDWAVDNDVLQGVGDGLMLPDGDITRAQMAQVLWNVEGQPAAAEGEGFSDVSEGDWFAGAVAWASQEGIFVGYDGAFDPDAELTREQAATVLMRWAESNGEDVSGRADLSGFPDADGISEWAVESVRWAVDAGVLEGVANPDGTTTVSAQGTATRAQTAALMMRLLEA